MIIILENVGIAFEQNCVKLGTKGHSSEFSSQLEDVIPLHWVTLRQQKVSDNGVKYQGQKRQLIPDAVFLTGKMKNQIFASPCSTVLSEHDINFHKRAWW